MEVWSPTFPNARTASPVIDGDLVITRGITANWGAQGQRQIASMRSTKRPANSSGLRRPATARKTTPSRTRNFPHNGKRVFYAALGDGSVACVNARTGDPIWRVPLFRAGINATTIIHNNDKLIAIFGVPYEPGQLIALKLPDAEPTNAAAGPLVLEREKLQLWAAEVSTLDQLADSLLVTQFMSSRKGRPLRRGCQHRRH